MIQPEVIARDKELSEQTKRSQAALDEHRWKMCEDPNGPRYPRSEYASEVGVHPTTVDKSIAAWAAALAIANGVSESRGNLPEVPEDDYLDGPKGGRPKATIVRVINALVRDGQVTEQPTDEQHATARRQPVTKTWQSINAPAVDMRYEMALSTAVQELTRAVKILDDGELTGARLRAQVRDYERVILALAERIAAAEPVSAPQPKRTRKPTAVPPLAS